MCKVHDGYILKKGITKNSLAGDAITKWMHRSIAVRYSVHCLQCIVYSRLHAHLLSLLGIDCLHTHTPLSSTLSSTLCIILVVMMRSKELKISRSHADSQILTHSLTVSGTRPTGAIPRVHLCLTQPTITSSSQVAQITHREAGPVRGTAALTHPRHRYPSQHQGQLLEGSADLDRPVQHDTKTPRRARHSSRLVKPFTSVSREFMKSCTLGHYSSASSKSWQTAPIR